MEYWNTAAVTSFFLWSTDFCSRTHIYSGEVGHENVAYTSDMFRYCYAFNPGPDFGKGWDMSNVVDTSYMFDGCTYSLQPWTRFRRQMGHE